MSTIALIWGILSILGFGVAFLPCLGSLNWLNIPFAVGGLIVGIVAASQSPPGRKGAANAGIVLCAIAIAIGFLRLVIGGGVL
ncbi:MAG: hypothetical protein JNK87_15730 [Bryobacterales bacterium]|nr:hypothetical protein [Bryobacterales bacterium]